MRLATVISAGLPALGFLTLVACGRSEPEVEAPKAAPAPVAVASVTPTGPLSETDLRRVCRAGLAAIHGQEPKAIVITGVAGGLVAAEWPAPVDGGRMKAECRTEAARVLWKPLELPEADDIRWMDQAEDPVNTFVIKGDTVAVTQTYPDGTAETAEISVPATQEAR